MTYELTETEAKLTRMLLIEESERKDKKELTKQAEMMQTIIDRLSK